MTDFFQALSINALDAAVLVVLLVFGIASYVRGFTASALTLAAWGGAFLFTSYIAPTIIPHIGEMIKPEIIAYVLTYIVIFIFSLIILKMIASMVGKLVKNSNIGSLDSAMGLLFGLVGGMFVISCLYMITTPFISESNQSDWFKEAKSRPLIQYGASMISTINPYFDEDDVTEKRKDLEALERMRNMMPSLPGKTGADEKYKKENQEEIDKLFEKLSNE